MNSIKKVLFFFLVTVFMSLPSSSWSQGLNFWSRFELNKAESKKVDTGYARLSCGATNNYVKYRNTAAEWSLRRNKFNRSLTTTSSSTSEVTTSSSPAKGTEAQAKPKAGYSLLGQSTSEKKIEITADKKSYAANSEAVKKGDGSLLEKLNGLANKLSTQSKEANVSSLSDIRELLKQKGMTPEEESDFELYEAFLNELGPSNSVLRATVLRFFELYVKGNDEDVKGRYKSVIKALEKFKMTKDDIDKNAGSKSLDKKAENCSLYALQMNRIAWICKLLRNARMHDRISYCKGEDKEKQNYLLNEGAKAMLNYSLAVNNKACEAIKIQLIRLSNNVAQKCTSDNAQLESLVDTVEKSLADVERSKNIGISALSKGKLIEKHRGYYCSVRIQKSMKRALSALDKLKKELNKSRRNETVPANKKEKYKENRECNKVFTKVEKASGVKKS